MGLEVALWRAIAVFRFAALGYALILMVNNYETYARPWLGWGVLSVMGAWSVFTAFAYSQPARRGWSLLVADLLVTLACLLASEWVVAVEVLRGGSATLPMSWVAAVVLAWASSGGRRHGVFAALAIGAADLWLRGSVNMATVNATVLLLLAGFVIGYLVKLALDAERQLKRATELEAATRERERLARGIHDSVLQVLTLISRRGSELGGGAAELGRLAAEQESTLRALVSMEPASQSGGRLDLRERLRRFASPRVEIATPATPVTLPTAVIEEVLAAVGSALDNVWVHCGPQARAWVLVEDEGACVTVTIRDNGPGIPAGRLSQAAAEGRLGIAQSIVGRMRDLGGSASVASDDGTEVELRVPR